MIRLPTLSLLVALALIVAACGGDDGDEPPEGLPPAEWAGAVCGSLREWQISLEDMAQELTQNVEQADSPRAAKAEIGSFLDDVIAQTDAMIDEVREVEQPAVDEGHRISADFEAGLDRMREAFDDARRSVAEVPTRDPEAFQRELTRIGASLQNQGEVVGETLSQIDEAYDVDEIGRAFEENEDCQAFTMG